MRVQQFESRLRDELRQMLKTWRQNALAHKDEREQEGCPAARPNFKFESSNCEQMPDHALHEHDQHPAMDQTVDVVDVSIPPSRRKNRKHNLACREVTDVESDAHISFYDAYLLDESLVDSDVSTG